MEVIIKHDAEINNNETGDYEVTFFCEELVIATYAFANDAYTALSEAKERAGHLLRAAKPDFVEVELKGVWH